MLPERLGHGDHRPARQRAQHPTRFVSQGGEVLHETRAILVGRGGRFAEHRATSQTVVRATERHLAPWGTLADVVPGFGLVAGSELVDQVVKGTGGSAAHGQAQGEKSLDLRSRQPVRPVGLAQRHRDGDRVHLPGLAVGRGHDVREIPYGLRRYVDEHDALPGAAVLDPLDRDVARRRGDAFPEELAHLVQVHG